MLFLENLDAIACNLDPFLTFLLLSFIHQVVLVLGKRTQGTMRRIYGCNLCRGRTAFLCPVLGATQAV